MHYQRLSSRLISFFTLWLLISHLIFPNQKATTSKNPIEKKVLDNGLTLIYQLDKSSAITVLHILIKGGQKAEPEGQGGLAYLTTQLTLQIPDQKKVQDLMKQASRRYMMGESDYTLIKIECLSEHLDETLNITTQIILKPLFSGLRIDRIKEAMLYRRKIQEDDSINVGHNASLEKLFEKTSYGASAFGSEESLKAIKKKDIKKFHESFFKGGNIIVTAASDMEKEPLFEILEKYFSKFPSGKPPESEQISSSEPEEKEVFVEKDAKQYFISLAYPLPNLSSRNFVLASLLENLLGKGPGSRLWALRSKEKLAYNVNCNATQMQDGGILEAFLETDKEKKEVAFEALKKIFSDIFEKGITEEELNITKINTKAAFLRKNETKEIRAHNLAFFEAAGLGYEFLNLFFQEVEAIGLEEINAYIKDILNPENGLEIIVGPRDEEQITVPAEAGNFATNILSSTPPSPWVDSHKNALLEPDGKVAEIIYSSHIDLELSHYAKKLKIITNLLWDDRRFGTKTYAVFVKGNKDSEWELIGKGMIGKACYFNLSKKAKYVKLMYINPYDHVFVPGIIKKAMGVDSVEGKDLD